MDWVSLSRLVPEIALVAIFVWFTLERDKRQGQQDKDRDVLWQTFLKEEREQRNVFSTRIAEEVKANTAALLVMNNVLIAHDTRTTASLGEMLPSLRHIENGLALTAEIDERS